MVANQTCSKCIDTFLLNARYQCEDPNCETADPTTGLCLTCKASYIKTVGTSICVFEDANCLNKGPNQSCLNCKTNYVYNENEKLCKFRDPDCKLFSEKQQCLECRANFYLNSKINACV